MEYFTYIRQLLDEAGCEHVRIFGGGGGTITPPEIRDLHKSGISRIYSPDDGRKMGLMGMIHDLMGTASAVDLISDDRLGSLDGPITADDMAKVGLLLTLSESASDEDFKAMVEKVRSSDKDVPVIGFTGTGGAGKIINLVPAGAPAAATTAAAGTQAATSGVMVGRSGGEEQF